MAVTISRKLILGVIFLIFVIIGELYAFSLHFETRAIVFRVHFVLLIQVFLFLVSMFLWKNLTDLKPASASTTSVSSTTSCMQATDNETREWSVWKTMLLLYFTLSHFSYLTNLFLIGKDPHWFAMLTYCSLGSFLQLATGMAILKLVNYAVRLVKWRAGNGARGMVLSKRSTAILAVLYAICAAFYGLTAAAQVPAVKRVKINVQGLSQHWHNTRIVQISDIHLGPTVGFSKLSEIVDIINSLQPDLVVMTGDLVDGSVKLLGNAVAPLARVKSTYGNFFVTGNHEYYTGDVDNWLVKLKQDVGFFPLHNSNVKLTPIGGTSEDIICLAGADDLDAIRMRYTGHGFDLDPTLQSCDPNHPVILLAHQPHAAKSALDSTYRVDLVLSGHTHGGQFFPMMIGAYFLNPFFSGLYRYGDSHVYVSQGTQYWGIPMRLGTAMEITEITLKSQLA